MSIYKNKNPQFNNRELSRAGEGAFYHVVNVKEQWIISLFRSIVYLVIGGIALPLRLVFRGGIGERSIKFLPALVSIGLFTFIVLSSIVGVITLDDWDRWTGERFDLTLTTHSDSVIFLKHIWGLDKLAQEIHYVEDGRKEMIDFRTMYFSEYEALLKEKSRIIKKLQKKTAKEDKISLKQSRLSDSGLSEREKAVYKVRELKIGPFQDFKLQYRKNPYYLLYLYLGFFNFFLTVFFIRNSGLKLPKKKRHSYHRGKSFLNRIIKGNQTLIWMIEALILFVSGLWFTGYELVQWRLLGVVIMVQSFALFIEEYTVHKRKRGVILDMIDAEIESRMIAEERANLIESEINVTTIDKVETVSIY